MSVERKLSAPGKKLRSTRDCVGRGGTTEFRSSRIPLSRAKVNIGVRSSPRQKTLDRYQRKAEKLCFVSSASRRGRQKNLFGGRKMERERCVAGGVLLDWWARIWSYSGARKITERKDNPKKREKKKGRGTGPSGQGAESGSAAMKKKK